MFLHRKTPLILSTPLSMHANTNIYLKLENLQISSSFKMRGIGRLCQEYAKEGIKKFIASSGGNAGIAVAYAARELKKEAHIVIPKSFVIPEVVNKLKSLNATISIEGANIDEASKFAKDLVEDDDNAEYISPFNHPTIWEGHSSIIEEIEEDGVKPDVIICAVGGGGLMCGIIQGLQKSKTLKNTPIIAAETIGADALAESMDKKKLIKLDKISSIATSLGALQVAEQAFYWSQNYPIKSQRVTDSEALFACNNFLDDHKILVEPACGAGLAVIYHHFDTLKKYQNVLCIVCGGNVVNLRLLNEWQKKLAIN